MAQSGSTNFVNVSALSAALDTPIISNLAQEQDSTNQNANKRSMNKNPPITKDDEKEKLKTFFSLDPETDMVEIHSFLQQCKEAKYSYHNQTIFANSVHQTNLDEIVAGDFEKKSIIPEQGASRPSPEISHLQRFTNKSNRYSKSL